MFIVRCSPRPGPHNLQSRAPPIHAACTPPPIASPGPQPAPHRVPCLRPSAVRDGLQPAPELGHLQRHEHALHVSRALLPAPRPDNLQSRAPPCTRCAALTRRLPPPGPQPAPHRVPCLRPSAARGGLQPAPELGHLQRHGHAGHVLRARAPRDLPPPICSRSPLPGTLRAKPRSLAASRLPARCLPRAPYVPCLRPSAGGAGLQPAPELEHLPRHGHALHVYRAFLFAPRLPNLHSRALYTARCVCTAIVPVHIHAACTPVECTPHPPTSHVPFLRVGREPGVAGSSEKAATDIESVATQPIRRMPGT